MGVQLADVQKGVLDTAKVIVDGMNAWNQMQGKGTSSATPPLASTTVSQPAVSNQTVSKPQSMAPTNGLAAVPMWVWAAGALILLWRLR
jgi:hypothetical protein